MKEPAMCANIVVAMQQNGSYEELMDADSAYDRVKEFVSRMDKPRDMSGQKQRPGMPLFPGLSAEPFRDPSDYPAVARLEAEFDTIASESRQLTPDDYLTYFPHGIPDSEAFASAEPGMWKLFLLNHMGGRVQSSIARCPQTSEIIRELPGFCGDYPWCDALFSLHMPGTRLLPHCSIDNLRIRIHLGIDIPKESEIRVDQETRKWESGKCMVFDESFEHETWNETDSNRTVLIVDVWHPDLSVDERNMLLKIFGREEVRKIFFMKRLKNINADPAMIKELEKEVLTPRV